MQTLPRAAIVALCILAGVSGGAQSAPDPRPSGSAGPAEVALTLLRGHVVTAEGVAAPDAVVLSSTGEETVTEADGSFWLELELLPGVERVEITAVQDEVGGRLVGSAEVAVDRRRAANDAEILTIGSAEHCQPVWLPTFGGQPGMDEGLFDLEVFDDGSGPALYAAGAFTNAGGVAARSIARWDGAQWSPLGSGLNISANVLHVFDDGLGEGPALYAGGPFTGGEGRYIAKWDGTRWSALTNPGLNSEVLALATYDDGSGAALYAGGNFTVAGGGSAARIAKWDGFHWSPLGSGVNGTVYALTTFDDGNGSALYAGGNFTSAGGTAANHIARWDGTSWARLGSGIDDPVWALTTFDDGLGGGTALYAGGPFDSAAGVPATRNVARWDGTRWSALGSGLSSSVDALTVFDVGDGPALYASGRFRDAGSVPVDYVAKWNGTSWSALGAGLGGTSFAGALTGFDDGNGPALFVGGGFSSAGGLLVSNIARWNGASWSSLDTGLGDWVFAQAVFDDGSGAGPALYAGGYLTAGGTDVRSLGRWNGANWSALGAGLDGPPLAMTVFDDGSGAGPALFVGGAFRMAGGSSANRVARWDGSSWSPLGSGRDATVRALAVFDAGAGPALYAGGDFSVHIARWDGPFWSPLGGLGASGDTVLALAVFDDESGAGPALFVGGDFTMAGGRTANNIARWDGSGWSSLDGGMNQPVEALAVFDDGSGAGACLIAAGGFTTAGGVAANHVAKWDGASWAPLAGGLNNDVHTLTVFDDRGPEGPALYAGGSFRNASGLAANRIARWNGSRWSPLGRGLSDEVFSLTVFDDVARSAPALIAGGSFTSVVDSRDSFIGLWQGWSCADTFAPTLACPASISVVDKGAPGEVVTFSVTASDDTDPSPAVVCVPPSGSTFPPGITLVTCKATDANGNQSSCAFSVTVASSPRRR